MTMLDTIRKAREDSAWKVVFALNDGTREELAKSDVEFNFYDHYYQHMIGATALDDMWKEVARSYRVATTIARWVRYVPFATRDDGFAGVEFPVNMRYVHIAWYLDDDTREVITLDATSEQILDAMHNHGRVLGTLPTPTPTPSCAMCAVLRDMASTIVGDVAMICFACGADSSAPEAKLEARADGFTPGAWSNIR